VDCQETTQILTSAFIFTLPESSIFDGFLFVQWSYPSNI